MNCPPELAATLLRIRFAGWQADAACCAAEADHVYSAGRQAAFLEHRRPA